MKLTCGLFAACALAAGSLLAADGAALPGVTKVLDGNVKMVEAEVVSLAEAMPADKFDFAPSGGDFKGVRTFGAQLKHIAAVNYLVSAAVLGEKVPAEAGTDESGPASVKSKEDIVKYLKGSFAYTHKAMQSVTEANLNGAIANPFGKGQTTRLYVAAVPVWHTFDHYGQCVVYARMNGVVPPASRQ